MNSFHAKFIPSLKKIYKTGDTWRNPGTPPHLPAARNVGSSWLWFAFQSYLVPVSGFAIHELN